MQLLREQSLRYNQEGGEAFFCDMKEVYAAKGEEIGSPWSIPKTTLLLQQCIDLWISAKHTDQVRDVPTILFAPLKVWIFSSLTYFFSFSLFSFHFYCVSRQEAVSVILIILLLF